MVISRETMKSEIISLRVLIFVAAAGITVKCCHHGKQAVGEENEFERKRRSLRGPDARKDLSDFFTECMTRKNVANVIPVMRSVVDFILRDTKWYKASDTYFCEGYQDTFGCWQGIMDLIIDWDSSMLGPSRECILEYSTDGRTGGYVQKRSITDSQSQHAVYYRPDPPCPQVNDDVYGSCITVEVNDTAGYPSLRYFHWESIAIFVREHLSRCRIEEFIETWSGKTAYRRKCGHSRYKGTDGGQVQHADEQCVPFLLQEVIKEESPLKPGVESCNEQFSDSVFDDPTGPAPVFDPGDVLIVEGLDPDQEFKTYGLRGMHGGSDIVGYCDPKSTFTRWYDSDRNNRTGDRELLKDLKLLFPGEICDKPQGIQIRVTRNEQPYYTATNHLRSMSPDIGLECVNAHQQPGRICENFKVRFCCLNTVTNVHNHNHPYRKTEDTVGTCQGKDKWGPWKNIDTRRGDGGDNEVISRYGQSGCKPVAVQGRIAGTKTAYTKSRNNFRTEDPNTGLICADDMQPKERPCRDFEVRFCCKDGVGAATVPLPIIIK